MNKGGALLSHVYLMFILRKIGLLILPVPFAQNASLLPVYEKQQDVHVTLPGERAALMAAVFLENLLTAKKGIPLNASYSLLKEIVQGAVQSKPVLVSFRRFFLF